MLNLFQHLKKIPKRVRDDRFFEITKEGRKHTGTSSAVCEERRLKRVPVLSLVEKLQYTRTARKNRAEKMIWPSEYRSMADAWELSGEEGRDKLR